MDTYTDGKIGESQAVYFLKKQGYKIVAINYKNYIGEIDIVAKDGDYLVFVEVKKRASYKFGLPREAVTPYKQNKIQNTARVFLQTTNLQFAGIRFDVIEIVGEEITHIKNAF